MNKFFKFKIFNEKRGFTLLELLIVIAIIGILTSIVLSALSNSRAKAYDSKIIQQLRNFRIGAETYFVNQDPNSYGPVSASCASGIFNDVNQTNGSPGLYITAGSLPSFSQVVCSSSGSGYAVKATLYSGNSYWCVDSKGANELVSGAIGTSVTLCP